MLLNQRNANWADKSRRRELRFRRGLLNLRHQGFWVICGIWGRRVGTQGRNYFIGDIVNIVCLRWEIVCLCRFNVNPFNLIIRCIFGELKLLVQNGLDPVIRHTHTYSDTHKQTQTLFFMCYVDKMQVFNYIGCIFVCQISVKTVNYFSVWRKKH